MLIPSIDLMGGKIVQLVQGERKELEYDDVEYWVERFSKYPLVQLIDLDAACGTGNNKLLGRRILSRLKCQVGGGIRSIRMAEDWIKEGAHRVIIGSSLLRDGQIDVDHARNLAEAIGEEKLVFAADSRRGRISIAGWRQDTELTPVQLVQALEPFCRTFLYTNIETEGLMGGFPLETAKVLRNATSRRLIVAGGITEQNEIDHLDALGIDAVVGMAVYKGHIRA